ncbi:MAG: NapC/NirT family cytochrome c [Proteobacteria bacterium]|nr:NapC/NirT family cytochrome c [Pseudomonadota bacterium]MBU1697475.1 NapC/NirT family cytochrome c [Pseudomonadota bacterium]
MNASVKKMRVRLILAISIPILLIVIAVASKATIDYTTRPYFCGGCHLMQTRYVSWKRSAHGDANATCFQCHSDPGLIGEAKAKINGIKYLYYEQMGYRDVQILRAEVSNESCMRCHVIDKMDEKMQKLINPVQHSRSSHKSHVKDLNYSCAVCHEDIMHITLEGASKKAWGSCKNCHKQTDFVHLADYRVN